MSVLMGLVVTLLVLFGVALAFIGAVCLLALLVFAIVAVVDLAHWFDLYPKLHWWYLEGPPDKGER